MELAIAHPFDYSEPFDDCLKAISDAGFRIFSIGAAREHSSYHTPDGIAQINEICQALGLSIHNIHAPLKEGMDISSVDEMHHEAGIAGVITAIEACTEVGCDLVVAHLSFYPKEDDFNVRLHHAQKSFRKILEAAEKYNVRIACENLPGRWSNEILKTILDEFRHPLVGLCFDSSHANLTESPMEFLDGFGDRLFATHLSDNLGKHDDHMLPGMGYIGWPGVMGKIVSTGFAGPLLLEVERIPSGFKAKPLVEFTKAAKEKGEWLLKMADNV